MLPLTGVRVADFSRVLAGPYAAMMLADFGAEVIKEVIKIESPAGDDTRAWAPPRDRYGDSTYFTSVNRNKLSVICDLAMDAREVALVADPVHLDGVPPRYELLPPRLGADQGADWFDAAPPARPPGGLHHHTTKGTP